MTEETKQEDWQGVAAFLAEDADLLDDDRIESLDDETVSDLLDILTKAGY